MGVYLPTSFRRRLRFVQAQTDKDLQELLAEALNDLFLKYRSIAVAERDTVGGNAGELAVCWSVQQLDGETGYCFLFQNGGADNFSLL